MKRIDQDFIGIWEKISNPSQPSPTVLNHLELGIKYIPAMYLIYSMAINVIIYIYIRDH